jgi:hypothetical protein
MADVASMSADGFQRALEFFSTNGNNWLETINVESAGELADDAATLAESAATPARKKEGREGIEEKEGIGLDSSFLDLKCRLSRLMRRREDTTWTDKEISTLRAFDKTVSWYPIDFDNLQKLYSDTRYKYQRRDMQTLLNNLNTELDRARQYAESPEKYLRLK